MRLVRALSATDQTPQTTSARFRKLTTAVRNSLHGRLRDRNVNYLQTSLAGIFNGSDRAWTLYVFRLRLHCSALPPIITASANNSRRRVATIVDGNRDGHNRDRNHLFTAGPAVRRTVQPISGVDIISDWEKRSGRSSLLHPVSIRRRYRRRDCRIAHLSRPGRGSLRYLCRHTSRSAR